MQSQLPRFERSPSPCALPDEPAEYFRDAPIDSDESVKSLHDALIDQEEPAEYFRDAPIDLDKPADYFRDAPVNLDESADLFREIPTDSYDAAEYFRLSTLRESLIDVDQTAEHFNPTNPNLFDTTDYQIFSQARPQVQMETDQWYRYADLPNVQSPFQPSRPLDSLLQPIQTPLPVNNPQMFRMGFCEPQETNVETQSEGAPVLGNHEDSIEDRLLQAMIGVPSGDFTFEIQDQGQLRGQVQGCPICLFPICVCHNEADRFL